MNAASILAEDHRSDFLRITACIYCDFYIYNLFVIHISIHIFWPDKQSIDKAPVTDLIKNFFWENCSYCSLGYFIYIIHVVMR